MFSLVGTCGKNVSQATITMSHLSANMEKHNSDFIVVLRSSSLSTYKAAINDDRKCRDREATLAGDVAVYGQ